MSTWNPETIRQAGVETRHVARMVGVHKVTASVWMCGHKKPGKLRAPKAARLMTAIEAALADKALPIPKENYPPDEWSVRVVATLQRYMRPS